AKTNVILGVHAVELRADPHGRELLELPFHIGPTTLRLDQLPRWIGLETDGIDHLVLGVGTDAGRLPRLNLIVRTSRAYDPAALLKKLGAQPLLDADARQKRSLSRVKLGETGLEVILWCADERTLVFGFLPGDVEAVPAEPARDLEQLPADLRDL